MKVGILTHYNVSSHGALLQLYGMQQELERLGHEVYILTYSKNMDFIDEHTRKRFSASIGNLPWYIKNYLFTNGPRMLMYQFKKQKVLGGFRNQHFKLMPYTDSYKLDAVVVGADEVFALENGVNFVMFGHGITADRLVAYAPSCGQTDLARVERFGMKELMAAGFAKYHALSARDAGTQALIKAIADKDAPLVCDPALLHRFGEIKKHQAKKKYIVVYSYQSNFQQKERIAAIQKYAKDHGCQLWSVGVYFKWCHKKVNCTPLEMLEVFAGAEAVITDTFHGTISSYIARTPAAVFVRENNNVKLDHLLQLIGLQDRKVSDTDLSVLAEVLSRPTDFDAVDQRVDSVREHSLAYLLEALKD